MSELTDKWRKLRQDIGNLICDVDGKTEKLEAEEKRMEQKRDESYKKGAEDLKQTMLTIMSSEKDGGMSLEDIDEIFNAPSLRRILEAYSADDVIEKVNQWKKEKQEETMFEVGDEVEHSDPRVGSCKKYIVIKADSDSDVLWLLDLRTFLRIWIYKDDSSLKKTGKHFDTIDIPEGGATI